MKKYLRINVFSFSIILVNLFCCNTREDIDTNIFAGTEGKLWIFKRADNFDCNCYYFLLKRDATAEYYRREASTGKFVDYFNSLSGDVENNNHSWNLKGNIISIKGFDYLITKKAKQMDTIFLRSTNKYNEVNYLLVDSKLYK